MAPRDKKLAKLIAKRIKELRKTHNMTQEDILYDTGIHVGRLETGTFHIRIDTVYKLCKYLGITLEDFFSDGFETL